MRRGKVATFIAAISMLAFGASACDGSSKDSDSGAAGASANKSADAKSCADFKALPDDADDSDTQRVIDTARSDELVDALKELEAYPDKLGFDDLDKVAVTYEDIRAACDDAGVQLPSFDDLLNGGSSDDAASSLPTCPETTGQKIAYEDIVKMNTEGCVDSTGGVSVVVYGGKCDDGRQFAYKNLSDIHPDPDGKDDRAYVVAAPGTTGTVIVDKDQESAAMFRLETNCSG